MELCPVLAVQGDENRIVAARAAQDPHQEEGLNPDQQKKAKKLFMEALDLEAGARTAFIAKACKEDRELEQEILSLLENYVESDGFLESPVLGIGPGSLLAPDDKGAEEKHPEQIGPYRIRSVLGEGGMGRVYLARQEHPVVRDAAIKVIKLGMDTREVITRFERERQTLAMMSHPNIARVFDAGTTEQGQPYIVMEYVSGLPITKYCDRYCLDMRQRLDLFIQICRAIHHAHQKGIIHRDIKPSNVLVSLEGNQPIPKVIDFGVAKAMHHDPSAQTAITVVGILIGTPEYMSPEQAEMGALDIDTRTDVYSLGVLLYELLVGRLPFEFAKDGKESYSDIQRRIREDQPRKPSTRLSTLGEHVDEIAKQRSLDSVSLRKLLRGDLDWIVMKALEKDRTRRYETPSALATDIERFLNDEPVEAGPPGALYRVRKFAKRNRVQFIAIAAVALSLVVGFVAAFYGMVLANMERKHALRAQAEAETARSQVESREAHLKEINEFLRDLFIAVDPDKAKSLDLENSVVLERAHALFGGDQAIKVAILCSRAVMLRSAGQLGEAEDALRKALKLQDRIPDATDLSRAHILVTLAQVLKEGQQLEAARDLFGETLRIYRQSPENTGTKVADTLISLKEVLLEIGDPKLAPEIRSVWSEAIDVYTEVLGERGYETALQLCAFGVWLHDNQAHEASEYLKRGVRVGREVLGDVNYTLFSALNCLTQIYTYEGRNDLAKETYMALNAIHLRKLGEDNPYVIKNMLEFGYWLQDIHDPEAEQVLIEWVGKGRTVLPAGDKSWMRSANTLLKLLAPNPDSDKPFLREVWLRLIECQKVRCTGPDKHMLIDIMQQAVRQLRSWGFDEDAKALELESDEYTPAQ
ncbi:MAG: serine/threonine-protein kinase [Planctomycetota bacterium]